MRVEWGLFMFLVGFGAGALTVLLGLLLARARRGSLGAGDRILGRLGSVGARRSLGALQD
jgi:hypothetical protein